MTALKRLRRCLFVCVCERERERDRQTDRHRRTGRGAEAETGGEGGLEEEAQRKGMGAEDVREERDRQIGRSVLI